jgi:putative flippase GtrA
MFKVVLGPGDVFLGKGHRTCSKCQQSFRDRSKEWPVISFIDRMLFLFPMVVGGWMLLGLVAGALFSYLDWNLGTTPVLMLVAIFFVMPLIVWFVIRGYQIFRSVRRFSLQGNTKAA